MNVQTTEPCEVHNTHQPRSHINEIHHVWPLGEGGPNVAANRVVVCATGHNNIHDLLSKYLKANGVVGWDVLMHYGEQERRLARLGYERIKRQAL